MQTITSSQELQAQCLAWKKQGLRIGLVPTMGFLHAGHVSLIETLRAQCDKLVVTLFVNPTQFGANEDLDNYPADLVGDSAKAEVAGADILFAPEISTMYDPNHTTWMVSPTLENNLCGKSREGHFRGVCTIVAKLFLLAQPDVAIFGEKDWQQLAILRAMARDFNFPVEVLGHPIVREADGLALSSRNAYLTDEERVQAPALNKALVEAEKIVQKGERECDRDVATIRKFICDSFAENIPTGRIDYVELVNPVTLEDVTIFEGPVLVAIAVHLGKARLIDNRCIKGY